MKFRILSLGLSVLAAGIASANTVTWIGSLSPTDSTWTRPDRDMGTHPYDALSFTVSESGTYDLSIVPADNDVNDPYLFLYTSFDPSQPDVNLIGYDDDNEGYDSLLTIDLTAGTTYTFVTTSYRMVGEDGYGPESYYFDYTNTITGPGEITTQAVPEPASMAALSLGGLALLRRRRKSA